MYKEPPGAQKMTSRLHCFRWLSSVQASRQALDSYFGSGGGDGAGNGGLARARPLSASRLASYLQTYLNPRLPDWILDLQVRHVDMFDTSASFWSLLEASEPSGSSSRLHPAVWMSSRCGTRVRRRFKMEDTAAPLLALAGPNVLYGRLTAGGARVRTSSAIARRPSLRRMCKGCRPTNGRSSPLIRTRLPDHRRCRCCMTAQALRRRILRLART